MGANPCNVSWQLIIDRAGKYFYA